MKASKNAHNWHCEAHDTYGWVGEECRKCPVAPSEITTLREQVEKWKSLHESLTNLNEAQERRHEKQVEKLTKERDASISDVDTIAQHNIELQQQLATLAEQNEKMLDALNKIHDTTAPYDDGVKFGYVKELALSCLQLPNLTTPALNKYRAEGMRMAADFAVVVRDDWVHVDDNHKAYAADYLVSSIRARADELEKINAAPFA